MGEDRRTPEMSRHTVAQAADMSRGAGRDTERDADDTPGDMPRPDDASVVADDLSEQVRYLREQLRREQDAHAEARRIIAGLVQRIPELEVPRKAEARETPETATAEAEGTAPRSDTPGPQTGARRPWWRRILER